jgi:hypothetical protein
VKFVVINGVYKGKVGTIVGRFCDPSYDDIELLFEDGERRWFKFWDVTKHSTGDVVTK